MALNRRAGCAKTGVFLRKTPGFALEVSKKIPALTRENYFDFLA